MDKLKIIGGKTLKGKINISGSKNASLPIMAASMLATRPVILHNIPDLADIRTMKGLLSQHGVKIADISINSLKIEANNIDNFCAPYDIVRKMRASVLVLGPLLARFGYAEVSLPGGCAIGVRPIDMHLSALEQMGAEIELNNGYIKAKTPRGRLQGAKINFDKISVGATENVLLAACLAKGTTIINNAASEPEVTDLALFLQKLGAEIEGIATNQLVIHGQRELLGGEYSVMPDRIEAGSYIAATAITKGEVTLSNIKLGDIAPLPQILSDITITETGKDELYINASGANLKPLEITTSPYPGFPTDMQAQMLALLTQAEGESKVSETIFENRFMHVPELIRMGANISLHNNTAIIKGSTPLIGAPVMATDLRASVSLIIAALAAEGETIINRIYHLDRGYEKLEEKLSNCGAVIERME